MIAKAAMKIAPNKDNTPQNAVPATQPSSQQQFCAACDCTAAKTSRPGPPVDRYALMTCHRDRHVPMGPHIADVCSGDF